ncbi:SDR family NAD(P)-dependent oxidoreductase [Microvirga tunisiensis]|uniref:SDR family NAD(P)-dependent oxidoreductase n=2 Tax=Pannonibacter tanglangensis TaxID=2750084 RepID=A0A7X5F2I2_9HYPH|nr:MULTISPECIES: SDR family oxidoreductase [unclassified Pannonibacter]NBN63004.1 SDR family NAD(P)-dependent oxidoreductase [Pannonibacter sp. XCT-34]NBN78576.1 SDR family NAD(P)-dependent oxidoreductase [Pannonibacter sp. XCT-53]
MSLSGKCILVTGASSGIGRATARAFLEAGASVVLTGRRAEALADTVALSGAPDSRALCLAGDVSDAAFVEALFAALEARFGRLDVVFNNAGISLLSRQIDEISPEEFRRVLDVNVTGAFLVARAAFALMRRQLPQGGRIINNGSISAHVPRPGSVAYTTSKHAITGLTRSLSLDGRRFNIACGQIDIGNAASDMTDVMSRGVPQANGTVAAEPVMDVQHVASSVLHMASLPLEANVQFMTVMATAMPFIGRG